MITISITHDELTQRLQNLCNRYTERIAKYKLALSHLPKGELEAESLNKRVKRCQSEEERLIFIMEHLTEGPFVVAPDEIQQLTTFQRY